MALQLGAVIDMASDGLEDHNNLRSTANGTRHATSRVVDIMARLQTPAAFGKTF